MSEFLCERLDEHTLLCASELSSEALEDNGLNEDSGLYLYLTDERPVVGRITVIAKIPCSEAAALLFDALASRLREVTANSGRRRRGANIEDSTLMGAAASAEALTA
jgi:hypothetical protein